MDKEKIKNFPESFSRVVKNLRKMSQEEALEVVEVFLFLGSVIGTEGALAKSTNFADGVFNCLDTVLTAENSKMAVEYSKHWGSRVSKALEGLFPEQ